MKRKYYIPVVDEVYKDMYWVIGPDKFKSDRFYNRSRAGYYCVLLNEGIPLNEIRIGFQTYGE